MNRTAIVIGAGFGGLALAIRLQSAGVATTIVEARDKAGGRGCHWQRQGFTFDAGPTRSPTRRAFRNMGAQRAGHGRRRDADPVMPFTG